MSIQQQFEEETKLAVSELVKLVEFAKKVNYPRKALVGLVKKLSRLELMILDSAFKEMDLLKLQVTILIVPHKYIDMIQNVTLILFESILSYINQ